MNRHLKGFIVRMWNFEASEVTVALTAAGILVNLLLFGVTAILAFYAYRQWVAVNQTLDEIKRQTPAVIQSAAAAEQAVKIAAQQAASSDESTKATLELMRQQSEAAQTLAKATQHSVATSIKQLDLAERPNLRLTDAKLGIAVNNLGIISYRVDVSIDNTGHNPATNTALIAWLILPPGYSGSVPEEQMRVCHSMDRFGPLGGEMISQGEKLYHLDRSWVGTQGGTLKKALESAHVDPGTGNRSITSNLVTCVLYRSPISQRVHHTSLMYDVGIGFTRDQASSIESGSMRSNDIIWLKPDQIFLHKQEALNGFAD